MIPGLSEVLKDFETPQQEEKEQLFDPTQFLEVHEEQIEYLTCFRTPFGDEGIASLEQYNATNALNTLNHFDFVDYPSTYNTFEAINNALDSTPSDCEPETFFGIAIQGVLDML